MGLFKNIGETIYSRLESNRRLLVTLLIVSTLLLVWLSSRLTFSEQIMDFMPLSEEDSRAMEIYQQLSGADEFVVLVQHADLTALDPDTAIDAIDGLADAISSQTSLEPIYLIDDSQIIETLSFTLRSAPYLLQPDDYTHINRLLSSEDSIRSALTSLRSALAFPLSPIATHTIQRDPLGLFTPLVSRLLALAPTNRFTTVDGYIFTPDMSRAILRLPSPYGNSETNQNSQLLATIESITDSLTTLYPSLSFHITGGPAIAVGNVRQITRDTIVSLAVALTLIALLLYHTIHSLRNLLLIGATLLWGALFSLACLSLVHTSVSIIVLGISAIILGIAVNYPLHLIEHLAHTPNKRQALTEILSPLLIGNITTVGAFLSLVPLRSVALRDLGLFSSLLLVGTIVFVLLFLPHLVKVTQRRELPLLTRLASARPETCRPLVVAVVILTPLLAFFSLDTTFDTNLSHINYMSAAERADADYFAQLVSESPDEATLYLAITDTTTDAALCRGELLQPSLAALCRSRIVTSATSPSDLLPSYAEQARRISQWDGLLLHHRDALYSLLPSIATELGFAADAFAPFYSILEGNYPPQEHDHFAPLTSALAPHNILHSQDETTLVNVLHLPTANLTQAKQLLANADALLFDIHTLNASLTNTLTDDFNYIGFACALIVFLFLWISMRSLRLAVVSFVPMAVSWMWILGIMSLLGIDFNIVNIILATFIFGQGDDYTIFITEGTFQELRHNKPLLPSYKSSILISATVMFIGIGTLILAQHPALHSLAEVTIVGMSTVVLMAYLIPPLLLRLFKW